MSILSFILPILTVVSLFLYILSAERAWLPKEGTTEWIVRASTPKTMTADIKFDFKWKDIVICAGIIIVYCAVQGFYKLPLSYYDLTNIISCALLAGLVYIFAQILFKNRVTAFFASAMTAADILLPTTFNYFESSVAIILFVLFILISTKRIWAFIPAGIFLSAAVYHAPVCILFTLLALCPAVVTSVRIKNGKPVLLYLIFCVLIPAAALYLSPYPAFAYFGLPYSYLHPAYAIVTIVCLIITIIHTFKDKSYTALVITVGLIISIVCEFFDLNVTAVFAGLAIAYPASIIIKRGKKAHKVFCIIFGSVMVLSFLTFIAISALNVFAPATADMLIDMLDLICPVFKLIN